VELEFELRSTRSRSTRGIWRTEMFEHDAFTFLRFQLIEQRLLLLGHECGFDNPDVALLARRQKIDQVQVAVGVRARRDHFTVNAQEVEDVEDVADGFTVDDEVLVECLRRGLDGFGDSHGQSELVDARH
jgi:hypothetical protein